MFNKIKKIAVDILFPKRIKCIICDDELSKDTNYTLCNKCINKLPFITGKKCVRCGEEISTRAKLCLACKGSDSYFTRNISAFHYSGLATKMIRELKYDNKLYLAETMSNYLVATYLESGINCDIVIPVPLNEKRLSSRGFNQAYLLSKQFAVKLGYDVDTESLIRTKNTTTQTYLTKTERESNVEGAFKVVDKNKIKGKTVLLVDDVYTTGSTLNACAKALLKAGAKKVYTTTFSHAKREIAV